MATPNPYGGRGPEVVGVCWALMLLTTILLILRVRLHFTRKEEAVRGLTALLWAWAGWFPGTIAVCFFTVAAHYGFGNQIEIVEAAGTLVPAVKWTWLGNATTVIAIGVSKFAIVTFYMAIQGPTKRWGQRFLMFLAVSNLLNNIVTFFLILFPCWPVQKLWDKSIPGTCSGSVENANYYYTTAGASWNVLTDVILALYPVNIVYHLQMPKRVKFGLCVLMGLGLFTAICSIVKTYELKSVIESKNKTYVMAPLSEWGMAEMWLVLITASIPPLWPIVRSIAESAAALSRLSSLHSLSSIFSPRRSDAARSNSDLVGAHGLVEVDYGKDHNLNGTQRFEEEGIKVQKAVTMTREVGRGSSVTSTASRAS